MRTTPWTTLQTAGWGLQCHIYQSQSGSGNAVGIPCIPCDYRSNLAALYCKPNALSAVIPPPCKPDTQAAGQKRVCGARCSRGRDGVKFAWSCLCRVDL